MTFHFSCCSCWILRLLTRYHIPQLFYMFFLTLVYLTSATFLQLLLYFCSLQPCNICVLHNSFSVHEFIIITPKYTQKAKNHWIPYVSYYRRWMLTYVNKAGNMKTQHSCYNPIIISHVMSKNYFRRPDTNLQEVGRLWLSICNKLLCEGKIAPVLN